MSTLNIGVIGLGRMGQIYSKHVAQRIDHARLVAVCDVAGDVAATLAGQFTGVTAYTDYHDLLAHPDLQAVLVTTPTSTHAEVVMAAAQAGKAIFCEKPTALTLADTDRMVAGVNRAGVAFQIGFMRRFDRGFRAAKSQIDAGVIGEPVTIRSISRDPFRTSLEYADPAKSGGIIVDMGIHDADVCRWLMGDEVEQVYAQGRVLVYPELAQVGDVDNAMILANFSRGGLGFMEASRNARYGYDIQCEIVGTEGALRVGYLQETPLLILTPAGVTHDVVPYFLERFGPAYTAQIDDFVECVRTDRSPHCGPTDARAALQITLAATQSQHLGRPVRVDEIQA
ncbi:MAG: inositol 2-dehydrogenase [Caldilineaceae bacterium]|nr:inositol 2-dehydrogenase [Caldilineaceae bacterium]MBP8107057.1 inositol 2-dehydrogenase [Caldilineaceae bacterium]MBP8121095.1 inositol 2-dehydrogenase [Caldilineaceae bacterium]MBP9070788.1 inositol 2-dehydrogenase [Caldilineaceae bacterium]